MTQKLAVLLVHGMERTTTDNLALDAAKNAMIAGLTQAFQQHVPAAPKDALAFQMALWPIQTGLQVKMLDFIETMTNAGVNVGVLRQLVLQLLMAGVVYQNGTERQAYQAVHSTFAQSLRTLAQKAGDKAPLLIIAHSIGAVMIANYLYDLQWHSDTRPHIPPPVQKLMRPTPLEKGETLSHLFTLGSPQALWAMRHERFGTPIIVPAPQLRMHYPRVRGQWLNLYDKDDVLAYPLQPLNAEYERLVRDQEVNVGGVLESWTPASHLAYWTDADVIQPIGAALAGVWQGVNGE